MTSKSLILVLLVYLVIASLYSYFVPALDGYDGIAHFNYINYLRKNQKMPMIDDYAATFSYELVQQPPLYYVISSMVNIGVPYDDADHYARLSENPYYGKQPGTHWTIRLPDAPDSFRTAVERARAVSVLGGLLAVLGVWLWVNQLLPGRPWLSTATAYLVGLNPVFLFLSVTVTNDAWAVAGTAITMWLITVTVHRQDVSWWRWFVVGGVVGLATLTKYSVLTVAIPAAILFFIGFWNKGYRNFILACLMLLSGWLLTAGFWYLRNLIVYQELVPLNQMAQIITTLRRPTPLSIAEIQTKLPWLFFSYWGVFGNIVAPNRLLDLWKWFVVIGCGGVIIHIFVAREAAIRVALIACLLWLAVGLISLINWMRTISYGDQARLLFVAAPGNALLLTLGWNALVPRRWQNILNVVLIGALIGAALWSLSTLAYAFAIPASLAENIQPHQVMNAQFENGIQVLGYDLPAGRVLLSDTGLPLTIYFAAQRVVTEHYTLFIHLVDEQDGLLYQFDGVPFGGRHPTRQWRPNQRFGDSYMLTAKATKAVDTIATLEMGFYKMDRPDERVNVYDPKGQIVGDRLVLGKIRVLNRRPMQASPDSKAIASWNSQIKLLSADISRDSSNNTLVVRTVWLAQQTIRTDYTVFVQLLDVNNNVIAQTDQQPCAGRLPTSTWLAGEIITDTYVLTIPANDWQQMIIGFYDGQTGQRLRLDNSAQGQDYYVLEVVD